MLMYTLFLFNISVTYFTSNMGTKARTNALMN